MAVENFLENMNALVEELKAHPKVTLLNYYVPAPATEQDFAEVEAHIGFSLPEDIKAFYRQCNGIQLRWVHKDNKHVDQKLWSDFMVGPYDYEEIVIEKGLDGVVYILGVHDVFLRKLPFQKKGFRERELSEMYEVNNRLFEFRALESKILNFDVFSAAFDFSLLYLDTTPNFTRTLLIGSDHRMPAAGAYFHSIGDYLDLIILKKGCADARIFHSRPKEIDYNSIEIRDIQGLSQIGNPLPFDLSYPYHPVG